MISLMMSHSARIWFSSVFMFSYLIFDIGGDTTTRIYNDTCPSMCNCMYKKQLATCDSLGKKLDHFPELPLYVKKLFIDNNYFPWLTNRIFRPIVRNKITTLSVKSSQIRHIGQDAFKDLSELNRLCLGSNVKLNVTSLKVSLSSLSTKTLSKLSFENMRWNDDDLRLNIFSGLQGHRIYYLSLKFNNIKSLSENSLIGLDKLYKLDLAHNLLKSCETSLQKLSSLSSLDISQNKILECNIQNLPASINELWIRANYISSFPAFCSPNGTVLLPKLQFLHLDSNNIHSIKRTSFYCLSKLRTLSLSENNIRYFPSDVFTDFHNLWYLYLSKMKSRVLNVDKDAFAILSLKIFHFDGNKFSFNGNYRAINASLSKCKNLETLDLSVNYMTKWPRETKYLLSGLTKLKKLFLKHVKWNIVPDKLFKLIPNVQYVLLSNNGITNLNSSLFSENSKITTMILEGNRIAHVGFETFTPIFWKNIKKFDLSGNPFVCDCKLLWFRDLLRNSSIEFPRYPNNYKCLSPPDRKGLLLSNFNLTQTECEPKSELVSILIASSCIAAFICITMLLVYNGRWHIRYWIYLLRYKRSRYRRLNNEDFKYDAFVIYSDEDSEFVHTILLDRLENEEGCRMCVHFRDFEVGKIIVDNIVECMSESRLAIVVVSKNFCNSKWCKFELLVAQDRWFSNQSEELLPVMLEEVDSSHMTKEIRALLQTTTYCKWSDTDVGQRLFWEQLINTLQNNS